MATSIVLDKPAQDPLDAYLVRDYAPIRRFLDQHPGLASLLAQAPAQIKSAFRKQLPQRLALFQYRDSESPPELHLVIAADITSDVEWDAAESSLHCLHENWLKSLPRELTKHLLIRVEPA